jgi:hypothetical protein
VGPTAGLNSGEDKNLVPPGIEPQFLGCPACRVITILTTLLGLCSTQGFFPFSPDRVLSAQFSFSGCRDDLTKSGLTVAEVRGHSRFRQESVLHLRPHPAAFVESF